MEKGQSFYEIEYEIYKSNFSIAVEMLDAMPQDAQKTFYYHFLRGLAFFRLVKADLAYRSFRTALEYKKDDVICRLYIACINLRNHKTDFALAQWVEILEKDAKNKYAKRAINMLRSANKDSIALISNNVYRLKLLPNFIPKEVSRKRKRIIVISTLLCVLSITFIPLLPVLIKTVSTMLIPQNERSQFLQELSDNPKINIGTETISEYTFQEILQFPHKITLSQKEQRRLISSIEDAFVKYRENEARVSINTLFFSNTSSEDKQRLYVLQKSLGVSQYLSEVQWFSFDDVKNNTWKYHNITVKWLGTVANIERIKVKEYPALKRVQQDFIQYSEIIKANFLVGFYTNHKKKLALVPIYFIPTLRLQNGDEVELLATVKYNEQSINLFSSLVTPPLDILLVANGFRYILE